MKVKYKKIIEKISIIGGIISILLFITSFIYIYIVNSKVWFFVFFSSIFIIFTFLIIYEGIINSIKRDYKILDVDSIRELKFANRLIYGGASLILFVLEIINFIAFLVPAEEMFILQILGWIAIIFVIIGVILFNIGIYKLWRKPRKK